MKKFEMTMNLWQYNRLKSWAKANGMSVLAAIRFIVNQFLKDKPYM